MRAPVGIAVALGVVVVAWLALYGTRTEAPAAIDEVPPIPSPSVAATPRPTATSTPSTSPTVTATAAPATLAPAVDAGFGYVFVHSDQRNVVQREHDGSVVFEFWGVAPAVSPDGRWIAYWRTDAGPGGLDLRVLDVADPSTDRSVFVVDDQTFGGAMVWSSDGEGLLIATYSRDSASDHPLAGPAHYDLLMLDLSATPPTTRPAAPRITSGFVYLPTLWDRAGQKAAAIITGEGGYARDYVTWDGNSSTPFSHRQIGRSVLADSVQPSPDGELLMARADDLSLLVWDVHDPSTILDLDRQGIASFWRPGLCTPCQAIVEVESGVETFFWETDRQETLYSAPLTGPRAIRPDGSAVLLTQSAGSGPPTELPFHKVLVLEIDSKVVREVVGFTFRIDVLRRGVVLR